MSKLYVVEGANLSLLMNNMATRRGKRLHYATSLNTFGKYYSAYEDKEIETWNPEVRTLCNLVVYDTDENEFEKEADCGNCLRIAEQKGLL